MSNNEHDMLSEELINNNWNKEISTPADEEKVNAEFESWWETLRNSRLAEKVGRLWMLFKSGKLSGFDKAVVVGALLYCISPIDLTPDIIPIAGYLDDLVVVLGVLAYLDRTPPAGHLDDATEIEVTPLLESESA